MFEVLFFAIGSNVLVCSVIAVAAILDGKTKRSTSIQHALWIVVLAGNRQSNKCSGDRF